MKPVLQGFNRWFLVASDEISPVCDGISSVLWGAYGLQGLMGFGWVKRFQGGAIV